ncbi:hypothetical protein ZYGM_004875 [Zygosaccharomyces mellis]|uniref:Uncharacterized protein n=1 Tax=Zygosaccharomyces mellis TaxID=42258 RepID=A0A4C2DZE5_9SACH|nr:hypothetical protein ZYGM_004875 [Zygosaccharomyces mellis]
MGTYLLKRRLRHVRSLKIRNLFVGQKNSQELIWFPSYFIVIENDRGQTLYVSELQHGSLYSVQFNELPLQNSPLTHFTLRLVAEFPRWLSSLSDERLWFDFRTYKVDLNQVKHINPDDIMETSNTLILELVDGEYVLPNISTLAAPNASINPHKRSTSSIKIKRSFTFNSILKLNKILEYTSQVKEESRQISDKVERQIEDKHKTHQWLITHLKDYNHQLQLRVQKKQSDLQKVSSFVERFSESEENDSKPHPLNDYYGNTYPNLIQSRNVLENLRAKKLAQLIEAFQATDLFRARSGFVTLDRVLPNSSSSLYDRLTLDLLNKEELLKIAITGSEVTKRKTSTCLGYYTLFYFDDKQHHSTIYG